jgi:hypothetical protein
MGRWEAEIKYQEYRGVARAAALRFVQSMPVWNSAEESASVRLSEIDAPCLEIWRRSWRHKEFDWEENAAHFQREVDRFEVAIWSGQELCGLAIGRVSRGPDNVTIHFLERRSGDTPLTGRIALLATETADHYAKILNKQRVKLKDPLPGAVVTYQRLNFVLVETIGKTTYYARQVGDQT